MITVFINPASGAEQGHQSKGQGQGQDLASHLRRQFDSAGLQARILTVQSPDETANAIRAACAAGTTTVVAAGGDGTVSTVAAVLVGVNTPLGVLPLGTLNHFAKDLRIPLQLEQAVQTIAAHHVTQVDVGEVNGRVFVNNSSIGIYPSIVVERERLREGGYRKWTAFAVATAKVIRSHRGLAITIRTDGSTERSRTPFLFVGNNAYRVDGIRLGGRDRLDGGQLFAYLAPRVHGHELVRLVASALIGRVGAHDTLESFGTLELRVDTPGRHHVRVATDGEVATMTTPLLYRARPRALSVIVPAPAVA